MTPDQHNEHIHTDRCVVPTHTYIHTNMMCVCLHTHTQANFVLEVFFDETICSLFHLMGWFNDSGNMIISFLCESGIKIAGARTG